MTTPRTVLVTGGNRGIGKSIAEEFIRQGHRVAVTVRSGEGPAGSLSVVADVTKPETLDAAFAEVEEKLGAIEILVANAGITRDTLLMRMTDEEFERAARWDGQPQFQLQLWNGKEYYAYPHRGERDKPAELAEIGRSQPRGCPAGASRHDRLPSAQPNRNLDCGSRLPLAPEGRSADG